MKFLQDDSFSIITSLFENRELPSIGITIRGKLEGYSRRLVRADKLLLSSLKRQYSGQVSSPEMTAVGERQKKVSKAYQNQSVPDAAKIKTSDSRRNEAAVAMPNVPTTSNVTVNLSVKLPGHAAMYDSPINEQRSPVVSPMTPLSLTPSRNILKTADHSPSGIGGSPLTDLHQISHLKIFAALIETMNLSYEDYDFRHVSPVHFHQVISEAEPTQHKDLIGEFQREVNKLFGPLESAETGFCQKLWSAIDDFIQLDSCDVYSFAPSDENDNPFMDDALWAFNYFFVQRKQIVYLSCSSSNEDVKIIREEEGPQFIMDE